MSKFILMRINFKHPFIFFLYLYFKFSYFIINIRNPLIFILEIILCTTAEWHVLDNKLKFDFSLIQCI